jgi:hypothetical protein
MPKDHEQEITDSESIFDPTEVKGPDPKVWGHDDDRPSATPQFGTYDVDDNGDPMEVKGPDPEVWGQQ